MRGDVSSKLGFQPLEGEVFSHLRERSAARVADDQRFAEIETLRAEAAENRVVKIADLLQPESDVSEDDAEDASGEAEENSPQLDEALQILVDLVSHKRVALH